MIHTHTMIHTLPIRVKLQRRPKINQKLIFFLKKRVLDRLADTPEFMNARKSGQVRRSARAPSTSQGPRRDAARTASETISQLTKDEKAKILKASVPTGILGSDSTGKVEKKSRDKSRDSSTGRNSKSEVESNPKSKSSNLKKRKEKRKRSSEIISPETKRQREDHGWTGNGSPIKRSILKPVKTTFIIPVDQLYNITRHWIIKWVLFTSGNVIPDPCPLLMY